MAAMLVWMFEVEGYRKILCQTGGRNMSESILSRMFGNEG